MARPPASGGHPVRVPNHRDVTQAPNDDQPSKCAGRCQVLRNRSPVAVADGSVVHCGAAEITKQGRDTTQPARQKYHCECCHRRFDDLTETVLAGRHQPLRIWILCLYFMGLNLSNAQIAQELGLNPDDVQRMTEQLRDGIVARQPEPILVGEVECDEVYVVAGHKGIRTR